MNEIANNLHTLLAQNIVSFTFRKVNGEIRHAVGTRNLTLASRYTQTEIPAPKGEEQPNSYYDVEKMGWRSYKPENLISIDGFKIGWRSAESTKKPELPKREIPINKPTEKGVANIDFDKILGGMFGGFGMPMGEIRKPMGDLDKDITIGNPPYGKFVGTPTGTEKGVALPLNEISVEDFAKMVAHYVVDELVSRIKG